MKATSPVKAIRRKETQKAIRVPLQGDCIHSLKLPYPEGALGFDN